MKHKIDFKLVELEPETYHILVKAEFNDDEENWWVIDTGASKSVFDKNRTDLYEKSEMSEIAAVGLGVDVVETGSGTVKNLRLSGKNFGLINVAIVNLDHINAEYSKLVQKKIIGLLGCDFLLKKKAIISFKKKQMILRK